MKVLVTGGAGFIGSHVVAAYRAAGHDVAVVDTLVTGRAEHLPDGVRLYRVDITDPGLDEVFARERPEVVNHHAARASVTASVRDPAADARVNVLGTINVLEQARRAGVRRFLFASTGGALYGEPEAIPVGLDHPVRPLSPYGAAKAAAETYVALYERLFGLPAVILRYANVYGPHQDPHGEAGVVAIFAEAMLAGRAPTIHGDGTQTRDFVYVEDVARLNVLVTERALAGVFHVATGVEVRVNEIHERLAALTGYAGAPQHGPPRPGEVYRIALDPSETVRRLGWRAAVSLEEGLRRTVEWFRARAAPGHAR
ncbi:MAG: NAD-dependent epimerase/dehydratase family protein [Armatimonadota bacterium]|nr:NAD-dependent epimerase/dehydratase family protein [Armatimonadota bacterium]MDR7447914.1 NAD-dependent epimerase/dehydratase family protein [Armatimonadota bacterium]MDR7458176.1 NAD-dependent epimerase/dehydratase family protein [Armatimonadota bacterium]MDR7478517.1 NAD-dependent epimerase/dehydratase family protein [Armatimonadota bacterium]MDR7487688.1 NAD-dependent epimerase/dehydratase family protein [Armatimonadota bacterium]